MCLKHSSLILSTLFPRANSPSNKIDVYLQPSIEGLIELWNDGTQTYDNASKNETFDMRVGLLWTISDFLVYGILFGWNVYGENACSCCIFKTDSK